MVQALVHEHLDEIEEAQLRRADLEAKIKSATEESDDEDGNDGGDEASIAPEQLAAHKRELSAAKKRVNVLGLELAES